MFRRIVAQRLRANAPQLVLRGASLDGVIAAMHEGRRTMVGALLIDAVRGLEGTIWRISAAPRACGRSEEHTSELQSLMRISYAVFCLLTKHITPLMNTDLDMAHLKMTITVHTG